MIDIKSDGISATVQLEGTPKDLARELIATTISTIEKHHQLAMPIVLGLILELGKDEFMKLAALCTFSPAKCLETCLGKEDADKLTKGAMS
jgi:hypothetical protein